MSDAHTRPRWTELAAVGFVACFFCFALLVGLDSRTDGRRLVVGEEASASFYESWERHRSATYAADTVFTREREDGTSLRFDGVRVQRPPDELVVSFSESELRRDDEVFRCVGAVDGDDFRCFGPTAGRTHDERVAAELEVLATYFDGDEPLYAVTDDLDGCFRLEQVRAHPIVPYGRQATFCFDEAIGALQRVELRFDNGVIERTELMALDPVVTDEDLRLSPPG
jgi:hypothetical protein